MLSPAMTNQVSCWRSVPRAAGPKHEGRPGQRDQTDQQRGRSQPSTFTTTAVSPLAPRGLSMEVLTASSPGVKERRMTLARRVRTPSASTGRQRDDGSRPSGNSSRRNTPMITNQKLNSQPVTQATAR